jgi:hypothetical protein
MVSVSLWQSGSLVRGFSGGVAYVERCRWHGAHSQVGCPSLPLSALQPLPLGNGSSLSDIYLGMSVDGVEYMHKLGMSTPT